LLSQAGAQLKVKIMQDFQVIQELQLAFSKKRNGAVVNLDKFLLSRPPFNLLRLEDIYEKTNGIIPPFRQSDFAIVFVKKGAGKRSIGEFTFSIQDNSLIVIPKGMVYAASYSSKPYGYLITFNPDFFLKQAFSYRLLNNKGVLRSSLQPFTVVTEDQAAEFLHIFEKIIEECNGNFGEKKQMVAVKLLELLILCERFFSKRPACGWALGYSELLRIFGELVEDNFARHRAVQFYAAALHTHPNHLNHIVKKATGLTAKQTITKRVIMEAKYLLVSTGLTVKEVAYELGFADPNYFISFFKKEQKTTPAHYRSQSI
jgi:AraC family transcriptional regulator, transcriptional activator of pobA